MTREHKAQQSEYVGFVGGIPLQATYQELHDYMSQFGPICHVSLPVHQATGAHKGFAKVYFTHPDSLERAVRHHSHRLHNLEFGVSIWVPMKEFVSKKKNPSKDKLFFRMESFLPKKKLKEYFSNFGTVLNLEIKVDHVTGIPRDFGFVIFSKSEEVKNVLRHSLVHKVDKILVTVEPSKTNEEIKMSPKVYLKGSSQSGHSSIVLRIPNGRPPFFNKFGYNPNLEKRKFETLNRSKICRPTSLFWSMHSAVDRNHHPSNLVLRRRRSTVIESGNYPIVHS